MPEKVSIVCADCGSLFTLTAEEQEWYKNMGFDLPKRCKECRKKRKANGGNSNVK